MQSTNLLVLNALLLLFIVGHLAWMLAKAKRAKRSQERLIGSLALGDGDTWFRVNVSRPAHFSKRLKSVGFEARGILVNSSDRIRVLAELQSGERIDRCFSKRDLGLRWIGNPGIASSNMHWIAIGPADQPLMLSADTGLNALQSREATADICRIIDPHFRLPSVATAEFALEKNPASLAAVAIFFALLVFAFVDGIIVNKNELLTFGKAAWGMSVAPIVAGPFYWYLVRRTVPSRESMTLSMLIGMALVFAYIPAIKRVDQLLAASGPTPVAYRLGPHATLEPVLPGPPRIDYSNRPEYWQQFDEGSTHYFDLTHGPLGLWQLDHTGLDQELRRFHESSSKPKKNST